MNRKEKGFTLAELLIVVAIIAVLVAIAIPVFTEQLEKSREATDLANVRAAYAEIMTASLSDDAEAKYDGTLIKSGSVYQAVVKPLKQKQDNWQTNVESLSIGGVPSNKWIGKPKAGGKCTVKYDASSSEVTINWAGFDLTTAEGREAAENSYMESAVSKAIASFNEGITIKPRTVNSLGNYGDISDKWYMWYYDADKDEVILDDNAYKTQINDLRNKPYGVTDSHKNQYCAIAVSPDGKTILKGWTYHGINNYYINWEKIEDESILDQLNHQ